MQVSHRHKLLLLENPRCGSVSFAKVIDASPLDGIARFATARDWRSALKKKNSRFAELSDYKTVVVVRDIAHRFASAVAALTVTTADSPWFADYCGSCPPEHFAYLCDTLRLPEYASDFSAACEHVLAWMATTFETGDYLPDVLLPQSHWLNARVGEVIAFQDLAYYSTEKRFGVSLGLSNTSPVKRFVKAAAATRLGPRIRETYQADVNLLSNTPVWSPPNTTPRTLTGACLPCVQRQLEKERAPEPDTVSETTSTDP